MTLWGNIDQANNAPRFVNEGAISANGEVLYGNTTINAVISGATVGIYGVDAAEMRAVGGHGRGQHAGWTKVTTGTGPVAAFNVTIPGSGYSNTDTVRVTGPAGAVNATGTIVTNGSGAIQSVTLTNGGSGFANTTGTTLTIVTSGGTGGSVTFTLGGRAGRRSFETLVAMKSITSDGADDAVFPDA